MDINAEINYQKSAPELAHPVAATTPQKFAEYANPPRPATDPLHCFLASIHRLKPKRIYELGAGAGEATSRLAKCGYEFTAVELSPELTAVARERARLDGVENRIHFVVGDALEHREAGEKFDVVLAKLVLHHLDLQKALDAICAHVKPDGAVLIYEPIALSNGLQWIRDRSGVPKDISPNERQLNANDLAAIASRFRDVKMTYFYLFARMARLFPSGRIRQIARRMLERIDSLLLPAFKHFSGAVVIEARGLR